MLVTESGYRAIYHVEVSAVLSKLRELLFIYLQDNQIDGVTGSHSGELQIYRMCWSVVGSIRNVLSQ